MENQDKDTAVFENINGIHPVFRKVLKKYEKATINIVGDQADADFSILMTYLLSDLETAGREAAEKEYNKAMRCCNALASQQRGHAASVRRRLEGGKTEGQWLMSRCLEQLLSEVQSMSQHIPLYGDSFEDLLQGGPR